MFSESTLQSLTRLLDTAAEQAQGLIQILQDEQRALLAENHDELENLIAQKLRISQALDRIEIQRQEIMSSAGQETGNDFMQDFLLRNEHRPTFRPLVNSWDNLIGCLKQASDQNRLNGILLEKQRQHVKRALNILFEQSAGSAVYDSHGGTAQPKYTRSVGVA